jgi:hypothetical protein
MFDRSILSSEYKNSSLCEKTKKWDFLSLIVLGYTDLVGNLHKIINF